MVNVAVESWDTYRENLKFVILFSIPFAIAFLIPLFAPLPTYISAGGIFLRSASIFINLSALDLVVIVIAIFLSLLFISFAYVAISLIVKAKKTHLKVSTRALAGIERYIGRVFLLLLVYTAILLIVDMLSYYVGLEAVATSIAGFVLFVLIFYAPSAIVVDNKRIWRAVVDSVRLVVTAPQYYLLWLLLVLFIVSALDFAVTSVSGSFGRYVVLVLNSIFILPYFVIFAAEAYMRRFKLLSH